MQREQRVVARRQDQAKRRRRRPQKLLDGGRDLDAANVVEVVDDHHNRLLKLCEGIQEIEDEARRRPCLRSRDALQRRVSGRHALHCGKPLCPESCFAELPPRRQPGDLSLLDRQPRRQQRGLAEARGSRDQCEGPLRTLVEDAEEARAEHERLRGLRNREVSCCNGT
jgi:hypothetical protein